ncbi:uncharacterized protein [Palaemon carinicauda]|uniref:uncharacterized protein n=1 Tax=Palaemon carinicauda TaxID=392227 RepID=UPI0035B60E83
METLSGLGVFTGNILSCAYFRATSGSTSRLISRLSLKVIVTSVYIEVCERDLSDCRQRDCSVLTVLQCFLSLGHKKMRTSDLVLATALVLGLLVSEVSPQGFQIDSNTILTLGAVAVASGLAYHVGRQHGVNEQGGGGQRPGGFGFPFFGRRRRQAGQDPLNELDPLVTDLFHMALNKDNKKCSLRLACAIGRRPTSVLTGNAKQFESVLSTSKKSESDPKESRSGLDAYQVALNLGRDGGNCEQLFPDCPNSSGQLMDAFQTVDSVGN